MKIPAPKQLPSGNWFIQLRLGGESIPVTDASKKECVRRAGLIKAEYLAGKREQKAKAPESPTVGDAIDSFIIKRSNTLSPATIRGYKAIRRNRFQGMMDRRAAEITPAEWIVACNEEATKCSAKTLTNSWRFIATVLREEAGIQPPSVKLPQIPPNERPFLSAEQIRTFLAAVKGTDVELPALLALSSLRRSEIFALEWKDIDLENRLIHVNAAAVPDEHSKLVRKKQTKNKTSNRYVPIMMDRLYELLKVKQGDGIIITDTPQYVCNHINRICEKSNLPSVGLHGLRHSFASLAKHTGMPEEVTMEIGGWSNPQTMRKIYTHISQKDAERYKNAMSDFYKCEVNANDNANEIKKVNNINAF